MPGMKCPRFSKMEVLKAVDRDNLLELLRSGGGETYFAGRKCALPADGGALDYEAIRDVLMDPDTDTPAQLAGSLYHIDDMSTDDAMQAILDRCAEERIDLEEGDDPAPGDVAVRLWLVNADLLYELHAEQTVLKKRSFDYFAGQSGNNGPVAFAKPAKATVLAMETNLDSEFLKRKKGAKNAKIHVYVDGADTWFLVRRGDPVQRTGTVEKGVSSTVVLRPEVYDVVIYNRDLDELAVNAKAPKDKELYCQQFGFHLFGRLDYFPVADKYTLEPLRGGPDCLEVEDVSGIEAVTLREVVYVFGGGKNAETEIHKAQDLFAAIAQRKGKIPDHARLASASFDVTFTATRKYSRMVKVRPKNTLQCKHGDEATVVDRWLRARQFIKSKADDGNEEA